MDLDAKILNTSEIWPNTIDTTMKSNSTKVKVWQRVYGFIESLGNLQVCIFVIFLLFNYGINYKIKSQELPLPKDICKQAF
jgi:hypothetical protein